MQTLDVISVNIWQILISLVNLFLIFIIIKKFLFKPVKKVLDKRQAELDEQYSAAAKAQAEADENRDLWETRLSAANTEADEIIKKAADNARSREDKMIADAKDRADSIIRSAQTEAELERRKAAEGIKREIVEVSGALTEKMLEREINTDDHRALIDSFINEIGDGNE